MMDRQPRMPHPLLIPLLVAVLGLNACADGGAIVSGGATACGVELTTANGVWIGSGNFIGGGTTFGLVSAGNITVLRLVGENPLNTPVIGNFYFGRYNPQTGTGTAEVYDPAGRLLAANQPLTVTVAGTLNVTVGSATTLMPMCPLTDGTGDSLYVRPSIDLNDEPVIGGIWGFDVPAATPPYTLTYTLDDIGNLTGNDTPGCIYTGSWRLLNPARNLYRVENLELENQTPNACDGDDGTGGQSIPFEGDGYEGFALIMDANPVSAELMWSAVANGNTAYFNRFTRTGGSYDLGAPPPPPPGEDNNDGV